jgi:hypothetical protein
MISLREEPLFDKQQASADSSRYTLPVRMTAQ